MSGGSVAVLAIFRDLDKVAIGIAKIDRHHRGTSPMILSPLVRRPFSPLTRLNTTSDVVNVRANVVSHRRVAATSGGAMPRLAGPPTDPRPSTHRVRARGRSPSDRRSR